MNARLTWAAPGAVLVLAGAFVLYALRGPIVELPRSPLAIGGALLSIFVLGQLTRLAALAMAWGVGQVFFADIFQEHAAAELLDELSARRLAPELVERAVTAVSALGLELPRIGRADDEALRDEKARRVEAAFALARAHAAVLAPDHVAALEGRVEGARSLAAALVLSALLVLFVAVHDLLFAHEIAHAFSSFSIVTLGVALAFAALAAIGAARVQARRLALDVFLIVAGRSDRKPT